MSRDQIARWIIEKLLTSFVISAILVWGPVLGFNMSVYGMGTTYTIITSVSVAISLLSNILVPRNLGIMSTIRRKISSIKTRVTGEKEQTS